MTEGVVIQSAIRGSWWWGFCRCHTSTACNIDGIWLCLLNGKLYEEPLWKIIFSRKYKPTHTNTTTLFFAFISAINVHLWAWWVLTSFSFARLWLFGNTLIAHSRVFSARALRLQTDADQLAFEGFPLQKVSHLYVGRRNGGTLACQDEGLHFVESLILLMVSQKVNSFDWTASVNH